MDDIKILLFSKKRNVFCDYAEAIMKSNFKNGEVVSIRGNAGDKLDDGLHWYQPEYIISFVSPWIIPKSVLASAKKGGDKFSSGFP